MYKTFLKAEWRKLAIANYAVDKSVLEKYIPANTEIDLWNNTCFISLVGFMFINTKVFGIQIPFHVNFEEVNLRFYVRYNKQGEWRRGVVFIREIVPKPLITLVARNFYNENYITMPMKHSWNNVAQNLAVEYQWKKKDWNTFKILAGNTKSPIGEGTEEEFITEHYWGYTKLNQARTSEYGVEHPRWEVYPAKDFTIDVDFANVYGSEFGFLSHEKPVSVFLAEGSEIRVKRGEII
ncbi:MAG: DUF2071 domain-containing protein [Bacteroidales bacterium]